MFRFCLKWSLQLTGTTLIGYSLLPPQSQSNIKGAVNSLTNSTRASYILFQSIYDYYTQLNNFQYNSTEYHHKRSQIHTRVANRILDLSLVNKGVYLKLGQYLGNLDRVMPWEYTTVLRVLQDSGPSVSYDEVKVVIQEDLGMKPNQIFSKFQKEAFAAASLAQVHRAQLGHNKKQVAVKIQFPFLRQQTKWDLWVLQKITQLCNNLMLRNNFKQVDLLTLYKTWTDTLIEQLDFQREIANAQHTRSLFKNQKNLYIPEIYSQFSSPRVIVMEYIDGVKISQVDKIKELGFDGKQVGKTLIQIFCDMIFRFGFVHCDAHPGNILVRRRPNTRDQFQIVLLDHGLYRSLDQQFIKNFSNFWLALMRFDKPSVHNFSTKLNIQKHFQYLPIIFLNRTLTSTKKLGAPITQQQRDYMRKKDIANFQSIHKIVQDLPADLMFVIRATNLIATHNVNLGGSNRDRFIMYTRFCMRNVVGEGNNWRYQIGMMGIALRLWIFENFRWLFRILYGGLTTN